MAQGLILAFCLTVAVVGTQVNGAELAVPLESSERWLWSSAGGLGSITNIVMFFVQGDKAVDLNVALSHMLLNTPVLFLAFAVVPQAIGVQGLLIALAGLGVSVTWLLGWAMRRQRRARNPLRGALLLHERTRRASGSVIAI